MKDDGHGSPFGICRCPLFIFHSAFVPPGSPAMSVFAQIPFPTSLLLAAVALTIFILLMRVQRYDGAPREPRPSWSPPPREKPFEEAHHLGEPMSMVQWEVEMHETARRLSAQLDSKMGVLEHLVREADRAAARLEAALAAAENPATRPTPAPAPFHEVSPPLDAPRESS